jgi:Tol biopolymer transport system component
MTREGRDLERLTFGISDNVAPSWAPNNREIVFNSGRAGSPQLYIMGSDGTNVRRDRGPIASRTGRRAATVRPVRRPGQDSHDQPDGSDASADQRPGTTRTRGRPAVSRSFSPNRQVQYRRERRRFDLERITPNDANYTSPAWSP